MVALFDENDVVSMPTLHYFTLIGNVATLPGDKGAAMGFRIGMALAMRHPEYAQAYLRMTNTPDLDVNGAEEEMLDGFVRLVPVTTVTEKED